MSNIFFIGPSVRLERRVNIVMLRVLELRTKEELKNRYETIHHIYMACGNDGEVQDQLTLTTNTYNLVGRDASSLRILPSIVKKLLDLHMQKESNPTSLQTSS